jgi:hypothetical protein
VDILVATLIIVVACTITCGLLFLLHRYGTRDALLADTTRGAGIYGVVGTSFAVLLAFVVFIGFQSYNEARQGAEEEADSVVEQFRAAEFFPTKQRRELQGELVCYGRAVVHHDWPAMRDQGGSQVVGDWSLALQDSYETLRVVSPKEQWGFGNLLTLSDERIDSRRQRLTQSVPLITTPVWFFLGIGALLNIAFVLIFVDRRSETLAIQFMLMASVTTIVIAGLLLIWFLDHPYENANGSIKPVEMERVVGEMAREEPGLPIPCSEEGSFSSPSARLGRSPRELTG